MSCSAGSYPRVLQQVKRPNGAHVRVTSRPSSRFRYSASLWPAFECANATTPRASHPVVTDLGHGRPAIDHSDKWRYQRYEDGYNDHNAGTGFDYLDGLVRYRGVPKFCRAGRSRTTSSSAVVQPVSAAGSPAGKQPIAEMLNAATVNSEPRSLYPLRRKIRRSRRRCPGV